MLVVPLLFAAAVDHFAPAGASDANGFLVADSAHVDTGVSALVLEDWAKDPVVLRRDGKIVASIVPQQWTSTAVVAGALDRFELSVRASAGIERKASTWNASLVAPRLALKANVLEAGPVSFAVRGAVETTLVEPAAISTVDVGFVKASVDVGPTIAFDRSIALRYAGAVRVPIGDVFSVDADVYGSAAPGHTPMEGALAAAAHVGLFDVVAGVGGGLIADVGTPRVRAFAGVRFAFDAVHAQDVRVDENATVSVDIAEARAPIEQPAPAPTPPTPATIEEPKPADAPNVVVTATELEFDDIVLFATESDRLVPESKPLLDEVARVLRTHPEIAHVTIEGHADATGDAGYNKKLSQWRALVVREYLVAAGIERARLGVVAYGTSKPRASNDSEEGRRQNRRVEMHIDGSQQ